MVSATKLLLMTRIARGFLALSLCVLSYFLLAFFCCRLCHYMRCHASAGAWRQP
jgi:hypothetical protein